MSQRGAFILNSVGHKQLTTIVQKYTTGTGTNTSTVYIPIANSWESAGAIGTYGWANGGASGNIVPVSIVDRIDFANDSPTAASPRGPLSLTRQSLSSIGNTNYGWSAGGSTSPGSPVAAFSTVDRIDFANDSPAVASPRGPLSAARYQLAAVGNANYGWFGGGSTNGGTPLYSIVDRIDYSNDSPASASPRGPLSLARAALAAANSANYGWFAGGYTPGATPTSIVDRIDFSNDSPTAASRRGLLSLNRFYTAATSNVNYGWVAGGSTPPANTFSSVERIDFANDSPTSASPRGPLTVARNTLSAAGNANYGWFSGGLTPAPSRFSYIDRIDYSNDSPTAASPRGLLTGPRNYHSGSSNYVKALPNFIGVGSIGTGTFGVFGFPTSVSTSTGIAQLGGTFGWWGGGTSPAPAPVISTVDRIDFANDSPTAASPRGPLSLARAMAGATANANYGWFAGGAATNGAPVYSTVDRIDFANDNNITILRGQLIQARGGVSATGNANYGWFGGGYVSVPTTTSVIERIDFANDSPAVASPRGPLNATRNYSAATSNANYGWWAGGSAGITGFSTVDRIDFANDSPTAASPRGLLSGIRTSLSATGNANYGWWGGGLVPGGVSTVDRIDFANDSPTAASPRGSLSVARYYVSAAGSANYGWFGGGTQGAPATYSTVDRIDWANDSPTAASPRGPLSLARLGAASSSNYVKDRFPIALGDSENYGALFGGKSYGWWGGGGFPATVSTVDRIDFANDSTTAGVRGPLGYARYGITSAGNANYAWFSGDGVTPNLERIDYSNDSPASASSRGTLTGTRYNLAATSNANYGWFGGGAPGSTSAVDRVDFANDLATASPRGALTSSILKLAATGNANYGWFGGGNTGSDVSNVDRVDFNNDTVLASVRGKLSLARNYLAAASNANYGWFGGGIAASPSSVVDRIDFANDSPTSASPRGPLSQARYFLSAASNANYGWFGGGSPFPGGTSLVDRIDFANDSPTAASLRGPLTSNRPGTASSSNYVKTYSVRILTTGSTAALNINLGIPQYKQASASVGTGAGTYGWVIGGSINPPATISTVSRIDFASDIAIASVRGSLPVSRSSITGVSNNNYGWSGGGFSSSSDIYRIDYSNDSPTSASPRSVLPTNLQDSGGVSNANYGWFGAGNGPVIVSSVARLDFSNDLSNASIRGALLTNRYLLTATGNANYGWFAGGSLSLFSTPGNSLTSVERIDFSNDSPTSASPRGRLIVARAGLASSSNSNYGWFGGGQTIQGTNISSVERIDFSNDSPTSSITRGPLSSARYLLASMGNSSYGWYAGGSISSGPTSYSTVDRIDFSNDSPTAASSRGTLNIEKWNLGSTSNYVK